MVLPYVYEGQLTNSRVKVWRGIKVKIGDLETAETVETVSEAVLDLGEFFYKDVEGNNKENTVSAVDTVSKPIYKSKNPSLIISCRKVHSCLWRAEKEAQDAVDEENFFKFMKVEGWNEDHLKKLLETLRRDDLIFNPRPGFWKCTHPPFEEEAPP